MTGVHLHWVPTMSPTMMSATTETSGPPQSNRRQITPIQWAALQEATTVESTMEQRAVVIMPGSLDCENDEEDYYEESADRTSSPPLAMGQLVSLQNADGSWNLTPELSAILGISEADIKAQNPDQNMESSVWATVLAVTWLHHNCRDQREEWELLERKAVTWVTSRAGSSMAEFVRVANELLKSSVDPNVFSQSRETEGGAKMAEGSL